MMIAFTQILALLEDVFFFLGYFSSNKSFEEKLSKEEEEECIKKMCLEKDEDAREKLINHNLRLVAHITKKYSTCSISREDLLSIGTLGLIKGINTYKPEKSTRFSSYIAKCIDNEILMAIRHESKRGGNVYLEDIIGMDDEGNNITLIDVMEGKNEDIADKLDIQDAMEKLSHILDTCLTPREREIVVLRYGLFNHKKYTQNEIASMLGISRSYISRIEKKSIEKLSRAFKHSY